MTKEIEISASEWDELCAKSKRGEIHILRWTFPSNGKRTALISDNNYQTYKPISTVPMLDENRKHSSPMGCQSPNEAQAGNNAPVVKRETLAAVDSISIQASPEREAVNIPIVVKDAPETILEPKVEPLVTHCPKCSAPLEGEAECSLCASFERLKAICKTKRREYAQDKAAERFEGRMPHND